MNKINITVTCWHCRGISSSIMENISSESETKISLSYWSKERCPRCGYIEWMIEIVPAKPVEVVDAIVDTKNEDITETIRILLEKLPEHYPRANFSRTTEGYQLGIASTIIFRAASASDAIKHTRNYVEARQKHPDLPVGVIYGIYD